jgi:hypothetical protein
VERALKSLSVVLAAAPCTVCFLIAAVSRAGSSADDSPDKGDFSWRKNGESE